MRRFFCWLFYRHQPRRTLANLVGSGYFDKDGAFHRVTGGASACQRCGKVMLNA